MRVRPLIAAAMLSCVPAFVRAQEVPAAAPVPASNARVPGHREGSLEITLSGSASLIDKGFNYFLADSANRIVNDIYRNGQPSGVMGGGQLRATINFSRHMGFAVGAGMANGNGALLINPYGAVTWTFNLNQQVSPFVDFGAGISRFAAYTGSLLGDATHRLTSSYTAFGGLGLRAMLGSNVGVRIEGRMSFAQFSGYGRVVNGSVYAGLSYFIGGSGRDSDGDGVADKRDACPGTPAGAIVDAQGCALDSDRDGVYDGIDQCADTPEGATVDAQGCALDSDQDGVFDGIDQCPNTPADARPVDARGCPADEDADGVPDYLDRCPNTPADARPVGANGCPVDTDSDGVPDYQDRCPDTPASARPVNPAGHLRAGCPVDSDGDGTPDYLDRCPNTPPATPVDANGCPVQRDTDGDGVIDANDRCPNTPPNTRVDAFGCPIVEQPAAQPAPPPALSPMFVLRNVTFRTFRTLMAVASNAELDSIAATMRATPDARWEIAGYTDNRGTPAGNRRLSQRRAESVRRYLIVRGVSAGQLGAVGYGAQNPVAPNGTAAGRALNRRIEIRRMP